LSPPARKAANQNLFDTVPSTPEHTTQRLTQFAREAVVPGSIIFLGDSITAMGNWSKVLNDGTVINGGVGGNITSRVLRRLKDITDCNPSKVFSLLGINDIRKNIPDVVIADNYMKIIGEIHNKCPKTKIYVQGVLPVNPGLPHFSRHYDKQEHILALNALLASHAKEANYIYIDIFHLFADVKGHLSSQHTYDGLHLRQSAYPIWVDYLKNQGYL
jgi:lysophospholipase L1-like esterase